MKPGALMPAMNLDGKDLDDLVAYLATLPLSAASNHGREASKTKIALGAELASTSR